LSLLHSSSSRGSSKFTSNEGPPLRVLTNLVHKTLPPVQAILEVLTQEGDPDAQRLLRPVAEHASSDVRFMSGTQGTTWVRLARWPPV
jgi:hypothetical protein